MTENEKNLPEIPGFFRDEDGKLQPNPLPSIEVKAWNFFYSKIPTVFGYSPTSTEKIKEFLSQNPRTEFIFCTIARDDVYSLNITYSVSPLHREITLLEADIFQNGNRIALYPHDELPKNKTLEKLIDEAVILHILPLVEEL